MAWALDAGVPALLVISMVSWLVARRRRRVPPPPVWTARSGVRLLEGHEELAHAVARAVRSDRLAANQISGRLAKYEGMTEEAQVLPWPGAPRADSA